MSDDGSNVDLPAILGGTPVRALGAPVWPGAWPEVTASVERALRNGDWCRYCGPNHAELEKQLREFHQVETAILCASGTAAIELALRGAKVGVGDEVILAAYDFKANFQNVLAVGATPVLVDVRPDDWQFDIQQLDAAFTDKTRAVLPSHLHGGLADVSSVKTWATKLGVTVIEDACQCPGALQAGRRVGSKGHIGVLSFGGSKLLSAGRGGALLTNSSEFAQRIKLYTQRGNEAYPLSELQAAALLPQVERLDELNAKRLDAVRHLATRLAQCDAPLTVIAGLSNEDRPAFYKLGMKYSADACGGLSRETFSAAMRAEGIALDLGFRGLHLIHSRRRFRAVGELPNATAADTSILVLHHPLLLLGESAIEEFIRALEKVRRHASRLLKAVVGPLETES